jgi:hypothetical protein
VKRSASVEDWKFKHFDNETFKGVTDQSVGESTRFKSKKEKLSKNLSLTSL